MSVLHSPSIFINASSLTPLREARVEKQWEETALAHGSWLPFPLCSDRKTLNAVNRALFQPQMLFRIKALHGDDPNWPGLCLLNPALLLSEARKNTSLPPSNTLSLNPISTSNKMGENNCFLPNGAICTSFSLSRSIILIFWMCIRLSERNWGRWVLLS